MKLKFGIDNRLYAVFKDQESAERAGWFFSTILRRTVSCFGQYDNAYRLI